MIRKILRFRVVAALVVTLTIGFATWFVVQREQTQISERQYLLERTEQHAGELVDGVADRLDALIGLIDFAMQQLRQAEKADGDSFRMLADNLLGTLSRGMVLQMGMSDAQGRLTYSTTGLGEPVSIADREHFKVHLGGGDRLFISKPLIGRVSGALTVQFSRPVYRAGKFSGVIVISISPLQLSQLLTQHMVGPDDSISLFDRQGTYLAHNRQPEQWLGKTLSPAWPFMAAGAAADGTYRANAFDGGAERQFAWKRLRHGDAVAVVGLDMRSVLGPMEARHAQANRLGNLLVGAEVVFAAAVLFLLNRLSRRQRELARSEARYRSLSELASDWYWEQDAEFRFVALSRRFEPAGTGPTTALGKTRWELPIDGVSAQQWAEHRATLDAHRPFRDFEYRRVQASGVAHWISADGAPMFDEEGRFAGYRGVARFITERKLAEEQLRRNEQRLSAMLAAVPDALSLVGPDGYFVELNAAGLRLLAADSIGQANSKPVIEYVVPEDRAQFQERREMAERAERSGSGLFVYEIIDLAGVRKWMEAQIAPLLDSDGALVGRMGVWRDVTARQQAMQRAQVRARLFAGLARVHQAVWQSPDPQALFDSLCAVAVQTTDLKMAWIGVVDGAGNLVPVARHGEGLDYVDGLHITLDPTAPTGQGPAATAVRETGASWIDDFAADTRTAPWQARAKPFGWVASASVAFRSQSGVVGALSLYSKQRGVWDEDVKDLLRHLALAIGNALDRLATEAARTQAEQALRLAQSAAHMVVLDWEIARDVLNFTDDVTWLRGPLPQGGRYPLFKDQVHVDDREGFLAARNRAVETMEGQRPEFRIVRTDGRVVWVRAHQHVIADAQGRAQRLIAAIYDITEQKLAEAQREQLEVQLRESQKMEAMGTLAGGIAHDFNNIIAAILGNASLASQDLAKGRFEGTQLSLAEISKAAQRARKLVQQILTFSRRQPIERHAVPLEGVIRETVAMLKATLPARLDLQVRCQSGVDEVLADATQIGQVLINLATNAMQAIGERPGQLRIELDMVTLGDELVREHSGLEALRQRCAAGSPQAPRVVRLRVADNGPGMDQEIQQRIFEPFFTTKGVGQGTGLGLSVVRGIVLSHEGEITLDSQPGQGATFTIYLPAVAGRPHS